jgi:hypothetical protein
LWLFNIRAATFNIVLGSAAGTNYISATFIVIGIEMKLFAATVANQIFIASCGIAI